MSKQVLTRYSSSLSCLAFTDKREPQITPLVNTTHSSEEVSALQPSRFCVRENTAVRRVEGTPDLVGVIEI